MFIFFSFSWLILVFCILVNSKNLLVSLILVEVITFICILSFSYSYSVEVALVSFFCIFVIEGVIGLSGLVMLVTFSGSDYLRSSSLLKC